MRRFLGFWFTFFRFCPWWIVKYPGEISFFLSRVFFFFLFSLYGPQVDPCLSVFVVGGVLLVYAKVFGFLVYIL